MIHWPVALLLACTATLHAALIDFPTENRALLEDRPQDFYMYVDRDFEGVVSKPWEGGTYGYVRGPQRLGGEVVFTSLHEGIDIVPLRRDATGKPLDDIRAAAAGKVVHASAEAGASNYGRYLVLEHRIEGSPVYTLYAHLASLSVQAGQDVAQGEVIGRLGCSGSGLNQERAHLHFEIALLLNQDFEPWYQRYFSQTPNKHGLFHGFNLVGFDPSAVLLACAKNPAFSLRAHLLASEPFYKITLPNSPGLTLIDDYPWLVPAGEPANPRAWTISFTEYGVPIRATAAEASPQPRLDWVRETSVAYHHATRGILSGAKGSPRLSDAGRRFLELLCGPM